MDRLLTVPNLLSIARLLCIPWFVFLIASDNEVSAAVLLAVLGTTDWVDGYIARRFDQVSTFGKVIDPTADRLLLGTAAITIWAIEAAPGWLCAAALLREALVGIAGVTLWRLGAKRIDVQFSGKTGALLLMISFPFFVIHHAGVSWSDGARVCAYSCAIPGLVANWYSMIGYAQRSRVALRAGRNMRRTGRVNDRDGNG